MTKASEDTRRWREAHPTIRAYRREEARKYRAAHPEVGRAAGARWRAAHPEQVKAAGKARTEARRADLDGNRRRNAAFRGRLLDQRIAQAGRPPGALCELCGDPPTTGRRLVWDHCHESDVFRGWLCDRCNRVLGSVNDSVILLAKMIEYLEIRRG